ncbi:redoxin domain-containing protein [Pseudomonas benzenivorans]|uniref:Redoxin domain-containing protein n=1 Tax=Pseudomonas benzenivorans TaxID=556533 RepID=A0ABZ0PZM1_9PSED|nr:redoxin domain-containing protein [Pseudomonas benzenivorans]WPC06304.1 redoxin domain-containing protein [Pseudomonas benzenivorans]
MSVQPPSLGQPAPWFTCRSQTRERFVFDTVAGRYMVLCFFGSAAEPLSARVLQLLLAQRRRFDDDNLCFFGVSVDPEDERRQRVASLVPGIRYFWDFERQVSALYGAVQADGGYRRVSYVLDPQLRVLAVLPFGNDAEAHVAELLTLLERLPAVGAACPAAMQAPVLVLPRVFEPKLCRALIDYYRKQGGAPSGFMQDQGDKTVLVLGQDHKSRRDCTLEDEALRQACQRRIHERLVPEIHKAFQFRVTRMERYLVGCYDASEQGHFRPHRDNTTRGTAHRRFAVSLFLNTGEYEGGQLRFPEFGPALYSAPPGGAVVFSCSLLHEATQVTRGQRYMFLPFLYDEEARRIREENQVYLASEPAVAAPQAGGQGG